MTISPGGYSPLAAPIAVEIDLRSETIIPLRRLLAVTGEPNDDGAQVILEAIELGHVVDDGEAEDG